MDAATTIQTCADLLMQAGPLDESPRAGGPVARVVELATRALAEPGLTSEERAYLNINLANALRHFGATRRDEMNAAYDAALATFPDRDAWHFDRGVAEKWHGHFRESLACMERVRSLRGADKAVLWNISIAATAIGENTTAIASWRALGISAAPVGASGRPFVDGLPPARIRIAGRPPSHGTALASVPAQSVTFEIVRVAPLSPCHGVIQSATFLESALDYGDVVLWDGAPVHVDADGTPCFPVLARLLAGDEHRFRFAALEQEPDQVRALERALPEGTALFIHRAVVHSVCSECATGDALRKHVHTAPEPHRVVHGKIIVPRSLPIADFAERFSVATRKEARITIAMPELYEAAGDLRRAGQHHKAWGAIERVGLRASP